MKKSLKKLEDYVAIGFDLDHCLVRYKLDEFLMIPLKCYLKTLEEENRHHEELKNLGEKDLPFMQNGLIIDLINGNIIKLGEELRILKAYHGFKKVPEDKIIETYGNPPKFPNFNPLNLMNSDYICCITYFNNQIPPFFAKLVEIWESERGKLSQTDYQNILKLIFEVLEKNYRHFSKEVCHPIKEYGHYFRELLENKEKTIYKQDKMLDALKRLKEKGKILFIVSNSHYEPVDHLMDHAFGENWRELFDFVIAKSHKPDFWIKKDNLFKEIDHQNNSKIGKEVSKLESNQTYLEGNAHILEENIDRLTSNKKGSILYFGDQYITDCVIAEKENPRWDTVCIIEELGDVNFGEFYDENVFGGYFHEDHEDGKIETFWWNYVRQNVTKVTSAVDSQEMLDFFYSN